MDDMMKREPARGAVEYAVGDRHPLEFAENERGVGYSALGSRDGRAGKPFRVNVEPDRAAASLGECERRRAGTACNVQHAVVLCNAGNRDHKAEEFELVSALHGRTGIGPAA